nr:hypothetical protein [Actinoplanes polyasparticus]
MWVRPGTATGGERGHLHELAAGARARPPARRSAPERMTAGFGRL